MRPFFTDCKNSDFRRYSQVCQLYSLGKMYPLLTNSLGKVYLIYANSSGKVWRILGYSFGKV